MSALKLYTWNNLNRGALRKVLLILGCMRNHSVKCFDTSLVALEPDWIKPHPPIIIIIIIKIINRAGNIPAYSDKIV